MEENLFVCPLCGNSDPKFIGYRNHHPYCRKCITFRGAEVRSSINYPVYTNYQLDYSLSDEQLDLSSKILENYKNGKNTLVHAVCGAGKTEIILETIKYALNCGDKVGFAIPRRDVVIEIYNRLKDIFKTINVIYVCGEHSEILEGDIVVLTTHQLFRYEHYFDLLIIDEIDAFPFKDNSVLEHFFYRASKKNYVMMSATPSDKNILDFSSEHNEIVELFSRYHKNPLPVPNLVVGKSIGIYIKLIYKIGRLLKKTKTIFIFTPTIEQCEAIFYLISLFYKGGNYVHSKKIDRQQIIKDFKEGKYKYLVTTAVLERGVTFKDLQVIVFNADHKIYDSHSLIQISGRVGRKKDAPGGEVIFIAKEKTNEMYKCIQEIERANKSLQNMLK